MEVRARVIGMIGATAVLFGPGHAAAQDIGKGQRLAREVCSICHAVDKTQAQSPNPKAPRFETIANVPGMTATALAVALRTSHETMPNLMLDPDEVQGISSYILSLRKTN